MTNPANVPVWGDDHCHVCHQYDGNHTPDCPVGVAQRTGRTPSPWTADDARVHRAEDAEHLARLSRLDRLDGVRVPPAVAEWDAMTPEQRAAFTSGAPVIVNVHTAAPVTDGPNHLLHAVLSILTAGLWLPVWWVINRRWRREQARLARKAARRG